MAINDLRFTYFRLTVHRTLFTPPLYDESEVLTAALHSTQSLETQRTKYDQEHPPSPDSSEPPEEPHFWIIQNVEPIEPGSKVYSFLIGRNRMTRIPLLTENGFERVPAQEFPFTMGLLDTSDALCLIAANSHVHEKVERIAGALLTLLDNSQANRERYYLEMELRTVNDPRGFVEQLTQAYAITEFSMTVLRPNPPNSSRFAVSCEKHLNEIEGQNVHVYTHGKKLSIPVVIEEAKSALSMGATAGAMVKKTEDSLPTPVVFGEDTPLVVSVRVAGEEPRRQAMSIWEFIKAKWAEAFARK